jgi:hypothetical protein
MLTPWSIVTGVREVVGSYLMVERSFIVAGDPAEIFRIVTEGCCPVIPGVVSCQPQADGSHDFHVAWGFFNIRVNVLIVDLDPSSLSGAAVYKSKNPIANGRSCWRVEPLDSGGARFVFEINVVNSLKVSEKDLERLATNIEASLDEVQAAA